MGIYACAMHELTTLSLQAYYQVIIDALESFHPKLVVIFHFVKFFSLTKFMNYCLGVFPILKLIVSYLFSQSELLN
jgi:hypothetical protein